MIKLVAAIALACLGVWIAADYDWSRTGVMLGLLAFLGASLLLVERDR